MNALGYRLDGVIGKGKGRTVYGTDDPQVAVKVARQGEEYVNRIEYTIWHQADPSVTVWLVPVLAISEGDAFLAVRRGRRIAKSRVPKPPPWLIDAKPSNWVEIDGRVLLADFGQRQMLERLVPC